MDLLNSRKSETSRLIRIQTSDFRLQVSDFLEVQARTGAQCRQVRPDVVGGPAGVDLEARVVGALPPEGPDGSDDEPGAVAPTTRTRWYCRSSHTCSRHRCGS